ncbi:MAG: YkgJ family cysteine cluster protein [Pyrinomonadaceae bacterium]
MKSFVQITRNDRIPESEFFPMMKEMYEQGWQNMFPPQIVSDGLSSKVKNNVITPPNEPIPDCVTCGACCRQPPCVGVRPTDNVDSTYYWDITAAGENGEYVVDRYMRRDGDTYACTALEGEIGERAICSIYKTRPKMCHDFEAGSDKCHALRRAFGIEPFLTLDEMSEARTKLDESPPKLHAAEVIGSAQITEDAETRIRNITAQMRDGTSKKIHTYDPREETWMQFEFDGYKLDEAAALIATRKQGA